MYLLGHGFGYALVRKSERKNEKTKKKSNKKMPHLYRYPREKKKAKG